MRRCSRLQTVTVVRARQLSLSTWCRSTPGHQPVMVIVFLMGDHESSQGLWAVWETRSVFQGQWALGAGDRRERTEGRPHRPWAATVHGPPYFAAARCRVGSSARQSCSAGVQGLRRLLADEAPAHPHSSCSCSSSSRAPRFGGNDGNRCKTGYQLVATRLDAPRRSAVRAAG